MAALINSSGVGGIRTRAGRIDRWVLVSTLALVCLGLIMVYSASISQAWYQKSSTYYLQKEAAFIALGLIALIAGARVPYTTWRRFSTPAAAVCVFLLVAVLLPHVGATSNGAQRWFAFKGFQLEPSELAKMGLAIYFAHWLSKKEHKIRRLGACTVPFGMMLGIVCILVLKQPDMGTAVVIAIAMVAMYFVAGARLDHLAAGILAGFAAALVGIHLEAYRSSRLAVWLDPWKYAHGAGYHTVQALIALGRGGIFGVGLGNSQEKYYLPAPFTDSIFAVTAEELGFIGAMAIVALFIVLAFRGFKISMDAPDDFGKLLAVGITSTIVVQALVNIAAITASIPFTGVPLPFISYGGSSLIISMFGVGVLLNISWQSSRGGQEVRGGSPGKSNSEGPQRNARSDNRRKDRRTHLPSPGRGRVPAPALVPVFGHPLNDSRLTRGAENGT